MGAAERREPTVGVRGQWRGEVPPELASVRVRVGARGSDRADVLERVSARVDEVRALVDTYGDAVERSDASALEVGARYKDTGKPNEKVVGYAAEQRLTLTVVDFTVLGDLLLRLADEDMVAVDGPYWGLRRDSPAFRRARTEAVRDARVRAEEYAAAAGSRLTGLVEIADLGFSDWSDREQEGARLAMPAMARGSVADRVTFEMRPVPQEVSATVTARFTVTQPDFS